MRGKKAFDGQDYLRAVELLSRVRALDPNDLPTIEMLGSSLFRLGYYGVAKPLLMEALSNDPVDAYLHYALGTIYLRESYFGDADYHLNRSCSIEPANETYQLARGNVGKARAMSRPAA